jgi:hypothetical protein
MRTARWIYLLAGLYGLLALLPQYFLAGAIGEKSPPAITHREYFYGFVGVALVWQVAFVVIATNPARYRPLMPVTMIEKLAFLVPAVVLYAQGQLAADLFVAGLIDGVWMILFAVAWRSSRSR